MEEAKKTERDSGRAWQIKKMFTSKHMILRPRIDILSERCLSLAYNITPHLTNCYTKLGFVSMTVAPNGTKYNKII